MGTALEYLPIDRKDPFHQHITGEASVFIDGGSSDSWRHEHERVKVTNESDKVYSYSSYEYSYGGAPTPAVLDTPTYDVHLFEHRFTGLAFKSEGSVGVFRLFEPFTPGMWLSIAVCCLGVILSLLTIQQLGPHGAAGHEGANGDPKGLMASLRGVKLLQVLARPTKSTYHVLAAILGGEDYEWISSPERILRLGLLFGVLLIQATYTANLAAFLVVPTTQLYGPKNFAELRDAKACALFPTWNGPTRLLANYVGGVSWPDAHTSWNGTDMSGTEYRTEFNHIDWQYQARLAWCAQQLRERKLDIMVAEEGVLDVYLINQNQCDDLYRVNWLSIMPTRFHVWFTDREFALNAALAMSHLQFLPTFSWIEEVAFYKGKQCPTSVSSKQIAPVDMQGFFLIWGAACALAVVVALILRASGAQRVHSATKDDEEEELDRFATEGQMLRYLIGRLDGMKGQQNEMKNTQVELLEAQKQVNLALWKKASPAVLKGASEPPHRKDSSVLAIEALTKSQRYAAPAPAHARTQVVPVVEAEVEEMVSD